MNDIIGNGLDIGGLSELLMNKFESGDTVFVCCPKGDRLEFKKQ